MSETEPTNEAELHDATNATLATGYEPDLAAPTHHECGSSAELDWTQTKEHDMTTNRDIAEAILDEIIAEGVTKPYVHDWAETSDYGTHPDEWTGEGIAASQTAFTAQPDGPWLAGSIYHAWSTEDCIPDVNQLYADLEHAKASTIELFLDSEVGSGDDLEVHAERAKVAARLGWTQKHGNWDLVYTDKPGMAGWTDVYIGKRHVLAKPKAAS